jgi:hypothetical protein
VLAWLRAQSLLLSHSPLLFFCFLLPTSTPRYLQYLIHLNLPSPLLQIAIAFLLSAIYRHQICSHLIVAPFQPSHQLLQSRIAVCRRFRSLCCLICYHHITMSSPSTPNTLPREYLSITIDRSQVCSFHHLTWRIDTDLKQHSRNSRIQHSVDAVASFNQLFAEASDASLSPPVTPQGSPSRKQSKLYTPQERWENESLRDQPYHNVQSFAYSPRVGARVDSAFSSSPASSCGYYYDELLEL